LYPYDRIKPVKIIRDGLKPTGKYKVLKPMTQKDYKAFGSTNQMVKATNGKDEVAGYS